MKRILFVFMMCIFHTSWSQLFIEGYITDEKGIPLDGANVHLHETMQGTATDRNGYFRLSNIKSGHYHLHVEYIGYSSINDEININNSSLKLNYSLQETMLEIDQYLIEESILKTKEKESTLKITMVDKSFLDKHHGFTLMQKLDMLPGINTMNTGTGISKPMIRGFSFNRVVVADKGIKQEGQQWGWDHGLEIDPFDAERIEIIRGPASLIYGSDAIGGVINIRLPELLQDKEVEASVLSTYRSVNHTIGLSAQAKARIGAFSLNLRYSQTDAGDYQVPADSFLYNSYWLPLVNQRLKNTAGKERNFSASLGIAQNWGYSMLTVSRVYQQVGFFSGAHGIPKSYDLEDDFNDRDIDLPYQTIEHWKAIWNNNISLGKGWLEVDLGFQFNKRQEKSLPHNHGNTYIFDTTNVEHQFELQTYTANARYHFDEKNNGHWIMGLSSSYQKNASSGFSYLIPGYHLLQWGGFVYYRRAISDKLNFNIGIRGDGAFQKIERYETSLFDMFGNQTGVEVNAVEFEKWYGNASGNVGLAFHASQHLTLRWNIGSSFRIPTVPELTANGVHHGTFRHEKGDSSLTQERGIQLDMSIDIQKKKWNLSVSPFFYYFSQFIYLRPTGQFSPLPEAGQIFQYTQGNTIQTGIEIQHDIHFAKNLHLNTVIDYVFALNTDNFYPLPFIPPAMIHTELEYNPDFRVKFMKNTFFRISPQGALPQWMNSLNEKRTDGYFLLGLGLGTTFFWRGLEFDLKTELNNLTNQRYMMHVNRYRILNLPEPGINAMITLVIKFNHSFKTIKN